MKNTKFSELNNCMSDIKIHYNWLTLYKLACSSVKNIAELHCNLCLLDRIKEIGHSDDNVECSTNSLGLLSDGET